MSVEKVDLQSVQPETKQTFQAKKSVQPDIRESHDEEKRNAAKLMKGAAALAVLAAAGIIGHKTGAFKKLGKMISGAQLGKNTKNAADDAAEAVANAGKKSEEAVTEAVNSANKATEEVKPAETLNNPKSLDKLAEDIDIPKSLDELAEEALKAGKKTFEIDEICENGSKAIKTFDAKTRKKIKVTGFEEDGETISYLERYAPETGKKIKETKFSYGKISAIIEYDPKTGDNIKSTAFFPDGISIKFQRTVDPETRHIIRTYFKEDGGGISHIEESTQNGKVVKETEFRHGKISEISEYRHCYDTNKDIKKTTFYADDKPYEIKEYNEDDLFAEGWREIKCTQCDPDGKPID